MIQEDLTWHDMTAYRIDGRRMRMTIVDIVVVVVVVIVVVVVVVAVAQRVGCRVGCSSRRWGWGGRSGKT